MKLSWKSEDAGLCINIFDVSQHIEALVQAYDVDEIIPHKYAHLAFHVLKTIDNLHDSRQLLSFTPTYNK